MAGSLDKRIQHQDTTRTSFARHFKCSLVIDLGAPLRPITVTSVVGVVGHEILLRKKSNRQNRYIKHSSYVTDRPAASWFFQQLQHLPHHLPCHATTHHNALHHHHLPPCAPLHSNHLTSSSPPLLPTTIVITTTFTTTETTPQYLLPFQQLGPESHVPWNPFP